jgi:hypothetical protein
MSLTRSAVLLALVFAGGCRHKRAEAEEAINGITVARHGSDYVFRFGHCGNGEEPMCIMDVDVYEIHDRDAAIPPEALSVCSIVLTHDPRMSIRDDWKYGDVPKAYKLKHCEPLQPDHMYRIEVTRATLDFRIEKNGDAVPLASSCRP